jgi:hypothetical protein
MGFRPDDVKIIYDGSDRKRCDEIRIQVSGPYVKLNFGPPNAGAMRLLGIRVSLPDARALVADIQKCLDEVRLEFRAQVAGRPGASYQRHDQEYKSPNG